MLEKLEIENVRIISSAKIQIGKKVSVFVGNNGSGKTSVLEGLNILATGRSFRTRNIGKVVKSGEESLIVRGAVKSKERVDSLAIRKRSTGFEASINSIRAKQRELASKLAVVNIGPESHKIVEGNPEYRRKVVDWALFHVEQSYIELKDNFDRVLEQRNELLMQGRGRTPELKQWDELFIEYGEKLNRLRDQYTQELSEQLSELYSVLNIRDLIRLKFVRGWIERNSLASALRENMSTDIAHGFTTHGPHRFDLKFIADNQNEIKHELSRGQQKIVTYLLRIAQILLLKKKSTREVVITIDDLGAELDGQNILKVIEAVVSLETQLLVTTCQNEIPTFFPDYDLFHVEQGSIFH